LWRTGLSAVVVGHAAVLLFPGTVLAWNGVPFRLYLLEFAGFASGLAACAGWVYILRRHLSAPQKGAGQIVDSILLSVVGTTLGSGLLLAWTHRWASSWAASTLTPYVRSLLSANVRTDLVAGMPFLVRLHVVSGFTALALLPLSSAGGVLARAMRSVTHSLRLAVRMRLDPHKEYLTGRLAGQMGNWLWPEEE